MNVRTIESIYNDLLKYEDQEWEVTKNLLDELFTTHPVSRWTKAQNGKISDVLFKMKMHEPYIQVIQLGKMSRKELSPGVYADIILWKSYSHLQEMLDELDKGLVNA